jgi:multidrug efflux pump subunit AcrA (membrane-fusion protein)
VALAGWLIIAIFFGGIGSWAATAPLNGAVVGNAVVKVDGNRKSVQHLDGGIVKELRVKEGDKVNAGDVLVVLDETQAQAEYDVLSQQYMVLRATEARLLTELDHGSELAAGSQGTPGRQLHQERLERASQPVRKPSRRARRATQRHP